MSRNKISDDEIVTHPNSLLSLAPNIFVILIVIAVTFFAALIGSDIWAVIIPAVILIVLMVVSINAYGKKIVFDKRANKIYSKSLFSNREYELRDVHSIRKVNSTGTKDYYILTTKSDPYGQGIKLTNKIAFGNRELEDFEENILPDIRAFVGQSPDFAAESRRAAPDLSQLSTYKKSGSGYYFYDVNTLLIIIGIALFGVSVWWIINFDANNLNVFLQNSRYPTPLFKFLSPLLLLLSLVIFGRGVLRLRINAENKILAKEYFFGAFKKTYKIKIPVEIFIQSNRQNDRHTETDVHIAVADHQKNSVVLRHFYQTGKVERFVSETEYIVDAEGLNGDRRV